MTDRKQLVDALTRAGFVDFTQVDHVDRTHWHESECINMDGTGLVFVVHDANPIFKQKHPIVPAFIPITETLHVDLWEARKNNAREVLAQEVRPIYKAIARRRRA